MKFDTGKDRSSDHNLTLFDRYSLSALPESRPLQNFSVVSAAVCKRKSGRPEMELAKVLRTALPDLPDDTRDLAKIASVDLEKVERFLRICILLLGKNKLLRMLAELKVEVIEGRGPHNPTGTLIWRLLTEISQPVRAKSFYPMPGLTRSHGSSARGFGGG